MAPDPVLLRGIFAVLHKELHDARAAMRPVLHIRITTDAIPGTVTSTPLTPERLRVLKPYVIHIEGRETPDVLADPTLVDRALEIVMHPQDWHDLLRDIESVQHVQIGMREGEPDRVWGIPVTRT